MQKQLKLNKTVFLDRDGVLNDAIVRHGKPFAPNSHKEFNIPQKSISTIKKIKSMGFLTIVVTNQPDIATGKLNPNIVESFHKKLIKIMPIDEILVCPHLDNENCLCRKPKPGLIHQAVQKYSIDLESSFLIGDRWRDVDCAANAGLKSIFIDYGYSEHLRTKPNFTISSIQFALDIIK